MKPFFPQIHPERYLNSHLILGMDLVVAVGASLTILLLTGSPVSLRGGFSTAFTWLWLGSSAVSSFLLFLGLCTYRSIIRYSSFQELSRLCIALTGKEVLQGIILYAIPVAGRPQFPLAGMLLLDLLAAISALTLLRIAMIVAYDMIKQHIRRSQSYQSVLIYGTSEKSVALITRLQNSRHYCVKGFLTYGKKLRRNIISGERIFFFENEENVRYLRRRYDIDAVLFATDDDAREEQERLVKYCMQCDMKVLIAPVIDEIVDGKPGRGVIRNIRIEDLLGRPEIEISMNDIIANFRDKTILVTGAAGSIGSELCRQLAKFGIRKLVMFDNAETPVHNLRLEFEERFPQLDFVPVIGDVRLQARLDFVFRTYRPQIVFHAAAYKHVPLMEENPCEAVLVNVVGSRNVADKCIEYGIEKMVMISTDKAVNPTNIMGCTKRLAEIYVQSLGLAIERGEIQGRTKFVTTRFGNVLGSNGSVIPRFREQIANKGPLTVTHPEIRRFFMTIPEACRLVMEAATISEGNQICVFDMGEPVKIVQLARRMIELAGFEPDKDIQIVYTGLRPGEKLYEEVLASKENTLPTVHERIRIAQVRAYDYADARTIVAELEELSRKVNIPDMVRLMKRTVPEFVSQHSRFEEYDRERSSLQTAVRV